MSIPLLDVGDLVGHPGASRSHDVIGTLDGLASELVRVAEDAPIRAQVLLESVIEGILVSGEVSGTWSVSCARCLTPAEGAYRAQISELCTTDALEDDDTYPFDPEAGLDLGQMLRDAIGVEMPFAPLCRPDCLGLCEICGGNRNLGECPGHDRVDPRFAVLSDLVLPDIDT